MIRREDGDETVAESAYDETRATARLPHLGVEILYRRPWTGNEEQILISLRAVPSFEAFGRLMEASNLLLFWTRVMQTAWAPWLPQIPSQQRRKG